MKQQIAVKITVEFSDDILQPDVDEAIVEAMKSLKNMLSLLPAVRAKISGGKNIPLKIVDVERA
jgi:hypothetical protein